MERQLYNAIYFGKADEAKNILADNPDIDVNWTEPEFSKTPLYVVCDGDADAVIPLLLARSNINVNARNCWGRTPFMVACSKQGGCARLLAADPRVDINAVTKNGITALKNTVYYRRLETIK